MIDVKLLSFWSVKYTLVAAGSSTTTLALPMDNRVSSVPTKKSQLAVLFQTAVISVRPEPVATSLAPSDITVATAVLLLEYWIPGWSVTSRKYSEPSVGSAITIELTM